MAVAAAASKLPDVDYLWWHRGPTHSLLALIAMSAAAAIFYPEIALAVLIGYLSHLILDSLTVSKIPWLWPLPARVGLPLVRTGGAGEHLFRWGAIASFLYLLAGH